MSKITEMMIRKPSLKYRDVRNYEGEYYDWAAGEHLLKTAKVAESFFGTEDDLSNPAEGIYYVRDGNYPYAFYLANGDIESFKNTLLNSEYENKPVDTVYPKFLEWSTSKGTRATDWYK